MFGKLMSDSDDLMWRYFDLLSFRPNAEIARLREEVGGGRNPRDVKFELGVEIVDRFHGAGSGTRARDEFVARFSHGALPEDIEAVTLAAAGGSLGIAHVLKGAGLVPSTSEVFRQLKQGAVKVDGERIEDGARRSPPGRRTCSRSASGALLASRFARGRYPIYSYVSTVSSISVNELKQFPWFEIAKVYRSFYNVNTPSIDLPFIRPRKENKIHDEEIGWNYPGREFHLWANVLASAYGWTLDYISVLDVDDALAMIQEILVDEQLQKEWQWSMSQNSYSYDPSLKKSKFIPLKRPDWMIVLQKVRDIPKSKIRIENIPVGIVLRWDDGTQSKPQ